MELLLSMHGIQAELRAVSAEKSLECKHVCGWTNTLTLPLTSADMGPGARELSSERLRGRRGV